MGDVFAILMPDGKYLYVRVIKTGVRAGGYSKANLIFIYKKRSQTKTLPDPKDLDYHNLLVPPILTNNFPWARGYFETIGNWPLKSEDRPEKLHFHVPQTVADYYDEDGNKVEAPEEHEIPPGVDAVSSFSSIDDKMSRALGIPLAPR